MLTSILVPFSLETTSNLRFHLKLLSREFVLTHTFDLGPKIHGFTVHVSIPRFVWIVPLFRTVSEWHQILYLGFLCLNMELAKLKFQNSTPRLYFQSRVIFVIFHIFGAFSQIGLSYLIFAFWGLWYHQFVETRSRLARNHILSLKYTQKCL